MTDPHRGSRRVRFRAPVARLASLASPASLASLASALLLALAPAAHAVTAQDDAPVDVPVDARSSAAQPALWIVQDEDSTLYLFGTMHFLPPETDWESPVVAAAFNHADRLVLEVADPNDQAAIVPLIQQYGMSPERPLSSLLTPEEIARFDQAARVIGASAAQMDSLRPWLAGVMLSSSSLVRAGYQPGSGVDMLLRQRALEAGMPVEGFETPEDQIRMLSGFPEDGQLSFLRRTLREFDNALTDIDALVEAWRTGDAGQIEALAVAPMRADSERVYQRVLAERNSRWADRIEAMLAGEGVAFIAVGAMHLAGDDSVQAILSARGVTVTRHAGEE